MGCHASQTRERLKFAQVHKNRQFSLHNPMCIHSEMEYNLVMRQYNYILLTSMLNITLTPLYLRAKYKRFSFTDLKILKFKVKNNF